MNQFMPFKIIVATANSGKIREIQALLRELDIELISLLDMPTPPQIEESGTTFEENALKKAQTLATATGMVALADDSGLCVDALGGRPGVHSARYGGLDASDEQKCLLLLEQLRGIPDHLRSAQFVCVMALVTPEGDEYIFRGECKGFITHQLRGNQGFGYDPIFYYPGEGRTFAEMDSVSKNRVSHRGRALERVVRFLRSLPRKS